MLMGSAIAVDSVYFCLRFLRSSVKVGVRYDDFPGMYIPKSHICEFASVRASFILSGAKREK